MKLKRSFQALPVSAARACRAGFATTSLDVWGLSLHSRKTASPARPM